MTPLEIVQRTSPVVNEAGNRFHFHPDTLARGKELGLDGFRFYILGRGGVLGDVESAVVASAFGYFHPSVVESMWTSASEIMAPRNAAREYLACADRLGIQQLDGLPGLDSFNEAAEGRGRSIGAVTVRWGSPPSRSPTIRLRARTETSASSLTDSLLVPATASLSDAQRHALVTAIELIGTRLA